MFRWSILRLFLPGALAFSSAFAQLRQDPASSAIRVTVSQNADGSLTSYETDPANKRATATTTDEKGRVVGKIRYTLDEAGRYATGEVLGPKGELKFRTTYKYDAVGRLAEELRLTKENVVQMKLVYAYDGHGKPAGYSVFDANGKLLGQTSPAR